ncbi:Uma2 family endonuclease [Nocardia terpenica]|uniref:Putative restriction endonuclease domain-containing protein n=1 Tax=Nocardia terpenica TaxID=455432 RepID=A0A161WCV6_9NOCA|nr:Uma2 family endonuclease [Nocardia terpenica]KZM74789.1 hypothetical protein AWN90_22385 [Nocardia terpenica]NQE93580.1 Uma2 family endonuclease [Nocardia terpenica]
MATHSIACAHRRGWTYQQVRDIELPYDWELVDGEITVRPRTDLWRNRVRDALLIALGGSRRAPYAVFAQQCVLVDEYNPAVPDITVVDQTCVDPYSTECLPPEAVTLVVDIVSETDHIDAWFRKPQLYATAGIAYFWRVERDEADRPIVYEYWLDHESGEYLPAPSGPHTGTLATRAPYPVRVDLTGFGADGH